MGKNITDEIASTPPGLRTRCISCTARRGSKTCSSVSRQMIVPMLSSSKVSAWMSSMRSTPVPSWMSHPMCSRARNRGRRSAIASWPSAARAPISTRGSATGKFSATSCANRSAPSLTHPRFLRSKLGDRSLWPCRPRRGSASRAAAGRSSLARVIGTRSTGRPIACRAGATLREARSSSPSTRLNHECVGVGVGHRSRRSSAHSRPTATATARSSSASSATSPRLRAIPRQSDDPRVARWENEFFAGIDAVALYHFIGERRPAHYFEVGSGHSTRFAAPCRPRLRSCDHDHVRSTPRRAPRSTTCATLCTARASRTCRSPSSTSSPLVTSCSSTARTSSTWPRTS